MKIAIIGGGGRVGSNAAYALQLKGLGREILLVDANADALTAAEQTSQAAQPLSTPLPTSSDPARSSARSPLRRNYPAFAIRPTAPATLSVEG